MNEEENKRLGKLIFKLARGDISALEEIYLIVYKILYAVGNIYYSQRADIEDAIHDLMLLLYTKASKFKFNKNACAWIIKLYQNMILRKLEHRRVEENNIDRNVDDTALSHNGDETYIENYLFYKELFSHLTEYEKELALYRYIGKCSIKDIADIIHKPKSTVESQLQKLENKLKNL